MGVKNYNLDLFLLKYKKVILLGICLDVGVVGVMLGGGIGFLLCKYGLSCDNVLVFNLIIVDG